MGSVYRLVSQETGFRASLPSALEVLCLRYPPALSTVVHRVTVTT